MISLLQMRRVLSGMMAIAIFLWWAGAGLRLIASQHGSECHARAMEAQLCPMHSQAAAATARDSDTRDIGSADATAHGAREIMPCCPSHSKRHPQKPGMGACCDLSSQPARPLAFLVASTNPLSKQLSVNGLMAASAIPITSFSMFSTQGNHAEVSASCLDRTTVLRI